MKKQDIRVELTLTEGYSQRFTEACLEQLRKRATPIRVPNISEKKKEPA